MDSRNPTVSIKQPWLRTMFTHAVQPRIQHFPAFRLIRYLPGFLSKRLVRKKHFQRIIIANKNIGIDIIQYFLHRLLRLL